MAGERLNQVKGSPLGEAVAKHTGRVGHASRPSPARVGGRAIECDCHVRPPSVVWRTVFGGAMIEQTPDTGHRTEMKADVGWLAPYELDTDVQVCPPFTVLMIVAFVPTTTHAVGDEHETSSRSIVVGLCCRTQ
jgi:hypothetical protein